ncbi:HNH endonuclease [Geomonas nitrogeniifigens]|uniref:HNH endonuclease n=1 Tax=Geomonas diazotrophica TaxID=2843197 RepID=A0ABX8JIA8_9BACT|nr:HNH endonuclease signature motif containing protein [Geomonas nitrogeniifigens]QWV96997.1 HNH endonuclease [Geomonas nitrogeniifigens]
MAYWWVNQNKTYKQEIPEGYMWSPKYSRREGKKVYNQYYENMRLVDVGDVVFSYYGQRIQHLGLVQHSAISGNKPAEFGEAGANWDDEGWFVPVKWIDLPSPISPLDFFSELKPHLPNKYSPLNHATGKGAELYLTYVPDSLADVLLTKIGTTVANVVKAAEAVGAELGAMQEIDEKVERTIKNDTTISSTEKEALVKARVGQGRFRANVESIQVRCCVTGVTDRRLLRASHIKPWRSCQTNHERLDGYNGLLLAPHIDLLFDGGYLSFSDYGDVLFSTRVGTEEYLRLGLDPFVSRKVELFHPNYLPYLKYHRDNVFLKPLPV